MALSKAQQNSINLDPKRAMLSMNMSVTPGDPTTQNNNPDNVVSFGPQFSAMPQGPNAMTVNKFTYQDKGLVNAPQLGANAIDPTLVSRTEVKPLKNNQTMFAPQDYLATVGINSHPAMTGKPQSAMGLTGQPAMMPDPMAMVPGSTKTTIAKKGKSNKGNA
jgi:hypothetical protein